MSRPTHTRSGIIDHVPMIYRCAGGSRRSGRRPSRTFRPFRNPTPSPSTQALAMMHEASRRDALSARPFGFGRQAFGRRLVALDVEGERALRPEIRGGPR